MQVLEVKMYSRQSGNYLGFIHFKSMTEFQNYNRSLDVTYSAPVPTEANPATLNEVVEAGYCELTLLI